MKLCTVSQRVNDPREKSCCYIQRVSLMVQVLLVVESCNNDDCSGVNGSGDGAFTCASPAQARPHEHAKFVFGVILGSTANDMQMRESLHEGSLKDSLCIIVPGSQRTDCPWASTMFRTCCAFCFMFPFAKAPSSLSSPGNHHQQLSNSRHPVRSRILQWSEILTSGQLKTVIRSSSSCLRAWC